MRVSVLVSVLLLFVVIFFVVPAASYAQSTASATSLPALPFSGDSGAIIHPDGSSALGDFSDLPELNTLEDRNVCLKMRTYVVARENPASDVTHLQSYHECLPAWKFDLRTSRQHHDSHVKLY